MKTLTKTIREAADVCHGSGVYTLLTRRQKKEAVLYCIRLIVRLDEERSQS